MRLASAIFFVTLLAACTRNTAVSDGRGNETPPPGGSGSVSTQQSDWSAIEQLESQAKAIAKTAGCAATSGCRAAPVGSRACGGPRYYIPYCAITTDSAALYRKLDEVAKAERAYNAKYQIVSTCEFRMPPTVQSTGGVCAAN
jgi:hypothetical protein